MKYKLIDHTADFGMQIFGSDAKDLFAGSAHAMFDQITDIKALKGMDECKIHVIGYDWSDLMVNWLRELLYLWSGREILVKTTNILYLTEYELSANVKFDHYNPDQHVIKGEIKAVTYHRIQVKSGPEEWEAVIIFDV